MILSDYIDAALHRATYERLADDEGFYAEVTALPGVWATGATLESCRDQLVETVESWIIVKLRHNDGNFPVLDGIDLNPPAVVGSDHATPLPGAA